MCGIALVLSGVRITGVDPYRDSSAPHVEEEVYEPVLSVDDFKAVLQRRGPDNLGWRKLFLHSKPINSLEKDDEEEGKKQDLCSFFGETTNGRIMLAVEGASTQDSSASKIKSMGELYLLGATLQLRGTSPVFQPLEDLSGNLLVYNGEIFGGIDVADDSNDAESLLHLLERCCSCDCHVNEITCSSICNGSKFVPEVLSTIKGPWALIYWQEKSKTLWFGRDAYGRRSLLVHWPTFEDSKLVLSSVSPPFFVSKSSDSTLINEVEPRVLSEAEDTECTLYWEELPCGIYSIHLKISNINEKNVKKKLVGEVRKHEWSDPLLQKIIGWDRVSLDPKVEEVSGHGLTPPKGQPVSFSSFASGRMPFNKVCTHPAQKVLIALRESVNRRAFISKIHQAALLQNKAMESAPIALLFSGGLDSMILAALLDQCLNPKHTIDLLNVSFDSHLAPDRVSARKGVQELQRIAPFRRWRLVEIDAHLSNLTWETKYVMSLIHPAKTYMDLNIGLALWLAAGGEGWVDGDLCDFIQEGCGRYKFKSTSRILLVGSGADEQCAGYGRHRTKYRLGGWVALQEEMKIDMQRIWKRNLGRDDRCISDQGKEARFPFLDEDLVRTLLDIPLWEIADLSEPVGTGDKKILREVARLLGLSAAAILPKRAIQFGSRIARESNRKNFGSNRAANQASAGSVEIRAPTQGPPVLG